MKLLKYIFDLIFWIDIKYFFSFSLHYWYNVRKNGLAKTDKITIKLEYFADLHILYNVGLLPWNTDRFIGDSIKGHTMNQS